MDTTLDRMMLLVNALQMRLFAAALFFYGMALAVHADYLLYMGVCAGFALLAIPIRVIFAAVEIAELLRGRPSASLFQ